MPWTGEQGSSLPARKHKPRHPNTLACQTVSPWHRLKTTNCPRGDGPSGPAHRGGSWLPAAGTLEPAASAVTSPGGRSWLFLAAGGFCTYLGLWGAAGLARGWLCWQGRAASPGSRLHPGFSGGHRSAGRNFLCSGQKDACPIAGAAGQQREGHCWSQAGPPALLAGYLVSSAGQVSHR